MKELLFSIIPRDVFHIAGLVCFYGLLVCLFFSAMLLPIALGIILCEPHPPSP